MGAVPGRGVLTDWFDVDRFRSHPGRLVVVRTVDRPTVVLGSTQPETVVDAARAARAGVAVVRRRSGGGLVHLAPGDPVWVDAWVPRTDPLWQDDVVAAAGWAGEWWQDAVAAVAGPAAGTLSVHHGPSAPTAWSGLVCFAGMGPGEVATADGRKVVGLAQWRSRQGALVHGCAYRHWDPAPLVDVAAVDDRATAAADLAEVAVGWADLAGAGGPAAGGAGAGGPDGRGQAACGQGLVDELLRRLPPGPAWEVARE
ncbi:MAG TPA: hypothetical protein VHB02_16430 [Acidimicrobiales bacterium]|nr:hypothetical protein [Acidimicrobiales bacterium]